MFATQMAKMKGAMLTTVVSEKGIFLVKKWGSDFVVNYQNENVLEGKKQYDAVIDLSGKMTFAQEGKIMKPVAVYVNVVPGPKQIIGSLIHNLFSTKKYRVMLLKPVASYLHTLAE